MANHSINKLIACPYCDRLFNLPQLKPGQKAICTCCKACLLTYKKNPFEITTAIALTGLILFIPALFMPMVIVGVAGKFNQASLFDCLILMLSERHYLIALALLLFAAIMPLLHLGSALYVSLALQLKELSPSLVVVLRYYHYFSNWSMIHVFFLGVIIAFYKLTNLEYLHLDYGFLALLALLLCSFCIAITLDKQAIWQYWEQNHEP